MNEEQMFKYDGQEYTADQVTQAAQTYGMSLEEYVQEFGIELVKGVKTEAAVEDATVGPPQKASGTESKSAPFSLAQPEFAEKPKPARAQTDIETEQKRKEIAQGPAVEDPLTPELLAEKQLSEQASVASDPYMREAKTKVLGILKTPLTKSERDEVEAAVNADPVVDTKQGLMFVGSTGPGSFNNNASTSYVYPYDHLKAQAIQIIKQDGGDHTDQSLVANKAKELYREELIRDKYKRKLDAVYKGIEDQYNNIEGGDEWYSSILNGLGYLTSGVSAAGSGQNYDWSSRTDRRYQDKRDEIDQFAEEAYKVKADQMKVAQQRVQITEQTLGNLQTKTDDLISSLENAETEEQFNATVDLINANVAEAKAIYQSYQKDVDFMINNYDYLQKAELAADLAGRSYNNLDVFENRFMGWVANTTSALGTFTETMAMYAMNATTPGMIHPDVVRAAYDTPAEKLERTMGVLSDYAEESVRYRQTLTGVKTWSDFVDAMTDLSGDQIGQVGLMAMTGGVSSSVLMGATTAGTKMQEMYADKANSVKISDAQFIGSALMYGLAEAGSEYITFGQFARNAKYLKGALSSGVVTTEMLRSTWTKQLLNGLKRYGVDMVEEGSTEAVSQMAQNLVDIYVLEKEGVNVFDGVDESFLSGAAMSGLMFQAPGVAGGAIKMFGTRNEIASAHANHKQILDLQGQQAENKRKIEEMEAARDAGQGFDQNKYNDLVQEGIQLKESVEDLYQAQVALMYTGIERIDRLSAAEKTEAIALGKKLSALRNTARTFMARQMANGKTQADIEAMPVYKRLTDELSKYEESLYDLMDAANEGVDQKRSWSSMEAFAAENNGIPSLIVSTKDTDTEKAVSDFVNGPALYQYYKDNYGEDVAEAVKRNSKQFVDEIVEFVGRENTVGGANRGYMTVQKSDGTEISVPQPRILVSKRGSYRHETAHMNFFNKLYNEGNFGVFKSMSNSLTGIVDALAQANPEKFGAMKRYSDLRKNTYGVMYGREIQDLARQIKMRQMSGDTYRNRQKIREAKESIEALKAAAYEEHTVAMLEYLAASNIDIDKVVGRSFVQKMSDAIGIKPEKYDVNDGASMLRMLRTFNKQFDEGKTRRSISRLTKGGMFKGEQVANLNNAGNKITSLMNSLLGNIKDVSESAKEKAAEVNKIYNEQGEAGSFEIMELYKPMIYKIFARKGYKELPNWDYYKEDVVSEIMYSKSGIYGLIQSYDPAKAPAGIAAYINSLLERRIIGVVNQMFGDQAKFYKDVTELEIAEGDVDSGTSGGFASDMSEIGDDINLDDVTEKVQYSKVRRRLGLTEQQMNRVRGSVLTNLLFNPDINKTRKWVPSEFLSELQAGFQADLFSLLKGSEGLFPAKNTEWFDYAEKMYDWLITDIPLSTWLHHKVNIFYKEKLDPVTNKPMRLDINESHLAKVADPNAGNKVYEKITPTKEEFMSWIKAEGKSWTTVGTRKDLIARMLVRHMALDATMETMLKGPQERFDPMTGEPTGKKVDLFERWRFQTGEEYNEIKVTAEVARIINRDPNIMFNMKGSDALKIAGYVAEEVSKRVKQGKGKLQGDIMQEIMSAEGDVNAQQKLAQDYVDAIFDAMQYLKDENVINQSMSKATMISIAEELLGELEHVTPEAESWKAIYRAGLQQAQARVAQEQAIAQKKAEEQRRKRKAVSEEVENQRDEAERVPKDKLEKGRALSNKWNEYVAEVFPKMTKKELDRATAESIYSRQPWWNKFNSLMSPMAEDFMGLLYWTLGKGELGDSMKQFYIENILEPFNRGSSRHDSDRVGILSGLKELNKSFKGLHKQFDKVVFKNSLGKSYTLEDVIKVMLWTDMGYDIPDINPEDLKSLLDMGNRMPNAVQYSKGLKQLFKKANGDYYSIEKPKEARGKAGGTRESWNQVPIENYVLATINGDVRAHHMQEFIENVDYIFNEYNINKLEALFGQAYVDALRNSISAMKSGRAEFRPDSKNMRRMQNWYNGSIAMIMFMNFRSAVLQLVSTTNYINWTDNNPFQASLALKNPKEFAKAFVELMQSDFMVVRRGAGKIDVETADLENFIRENKWGTAYSQMTKFGYMMTKYADSAAILMGGTPFYINRIKTYQKQGMSLMDAKQKAFDDFRAQTEENQQSARQDKLSAQQRHPFIKTMLAFGNTSGQYSRIILKAAKDLKNGRGDAKQNVSKIVYYMMIQNAMFNILQQGIFRFWLDEDEEESGWKQFKDSDSFADVVNAMADNLARGFGLYGALGVTLKNTALKYNEVFQPDWQKENIFKSRGFEIFKTASGIQPALSQKVRGIDQMAFHRGMMERTKDKTGAYSLDDNAIGLTSTAAEVFFNLPLRRAMTKFDNVQAAYNNDYNMALRVANVLGWPEWQVDPEGSKERRSKKYEQKIEKILGPEETIEQKRERLRNQTTKQEEEEEKKAPAGDQKSRREALRNKYK